VHFHGELPGYTQDAFMKRKGVCSVRRITRIYVRFLREKEKSNPYISRAGANIGVL
jgi:hypothetical protein